MTLEAYTPRNADEVALVAYMQKHERFTHADLARGTSASQYRRTNLVAKLLRMAMIFEIDREDGRKVFTALDRKAADAYAAQKRQTAPGLMWTAMRSLVQFTPDEILSICRDKVPDLKRDKVQTYCSRLQKSGYLQVMQKAQAGGRAARYRLVRDTGPLAPTVRTLECIVDGNTDKAVYIAGNRL